MKNRYPRNHKKRFSTKRDSQLSTSFSRFQYKDTMKKKCKQTVKCSPTAAPPIQLVSFASFWSINETAHAAALASSKLSADSAFSPQTRSREKEAKFSPIVNNKTLAHVFGLGTSMLICIYKRINKRPLSNRPRRKYD